MSTLILAIGIAMVAVGAPQDVTLGVLLFALAMLLRDSYKLIRGIADTFKERA